MNDLTLVYSDEFKKHVMDRAHPESPERLNQIIKAAKELMGECEEKIEVTDSENIEIDDLLAVHVPDHVDKIRAISDSGGGMITIDTTLNEHTYRTAKLAAGATKQAVQLVDENKTKASFAVVRPPGHHAVPQGAMGFCIFNNIAIAARTLQAEKNLERIAIVDFDVHHGNGTQDSFYDDPNTLFISTHQYPHYPGTGNIMETGTKEGEGTTINIPLPVGTSDNEFIQIYDQIIIPALERYRPQFILVSAGYDAHWDDPLAGLGLSLEGLAWISRKLIETADKYCDGKIVFTLEGGYNLNVLSNGVANSIRALLGRDDFTDPLGNFVGEGINIEKLISEVIKIHQL